MNEPLKERIVGRDWRRTAAQLTVASIFVGAALALVGVTPGDFWSGIARALANIIAALGQNIGAVIRSLAEYFFFGAAIVVPLWLVSRLFSGDRRPK